MNRALINTFQIDKVGLASNQKKYVYQLNFFFKYSKPYLYKYVLLYNKMYPFTFFFS